MMFKVQNSPCQHRMLLGAVLSSFTSKNSAHKNKCVLWPGFSRLAPSSVDLSCVGKNDVNDLAFHPIQLKNFDRQQTK